MIINNTYFKGDIYIPQAKPSITDDVANVGKEIISFIDEYSRNCLLSCLGDLFYDLELILDPSRPDGIDDAAELKWDNLVNGLEYIDPITGKRVNWRGLRFKSNASGEYDKSLIAYYVYFYFEKSSYITKTDIGDAVLKGKNSNIVVPTQKVVASWNKFVEMTQGVSVKPSYVVNNGMLGVDYYTGGKTDVCLYKFINDSNIIEENTYQGFNPTVFRKLNVFGL